MPQSKSKTVVLFPPKIELSSLTNKYDVVIVVRWGDFEKVLKINKEQVNGNLLWNNIVKELNDALLEGSETNPYILK